MDSRLIFAVALWMSCLMVRIQAQDNSTTANPTTSNSTTANPTAANSTAANPTAANSTVANSTAANSTAANSTAANPTTANPTTANPTTANPTTANPTTAQSSPIKATSILNETITRSDCGKKKACLSAPKDCDPSVSGGCIFFGSKSKQNTNRHTLELSGNSSDNRYIAICLSKTKQGNNDTSFVCAVNNGTVFVITAIFNNNNLIPDPLSLGENLLGSFVNGTLQCSFDAIGLNAVSRAADTTFTATLVTGTYNGTLGTPEIRLNATAVDLTGPTSGGSHPLSEVLLILLGVLSLKAL